MLSSFVHTTSTSTSGFMRGFLIAQKTRSVDHDTGGSLWEVWLSCLPMMIIVTGSNSKDRIQFGVAQVSILYHCHKRIHCFAHRMKIELIGFSHIFQLLVKAKKVLVS